MRERDETRDHAAERLQVAREHRDENAKRYDTAAGSTSELAAYTDLQAAEDQLAAREAWLAWVDRDY